VEAAVLPAEMPEAVGRAVAAWEMAVRRLRQEGAGVGDFPAVMPEAGQGRERLSPAA